MRTSYRIALLLFLIGTALRLLLWWITPPQIAVDNHFQPIEMLMATGAIPPKDACFQCYQPPVLYLLAAAVGKLFLFLGGSAGLLRKALQLVNCCYGIATLPVIYLILKRFPVGELPRLLAFGLVCFLPRHIYLGALHGNDTISILAVALCVYCLLRVIDSRGSLTWLSTLSVVATVAVFTKYTVLVVLLLTVTTFMLLVGTGLLAARGRARIAAATLTLLPLLIFGAYGLNNLQTYGKVLPWNDTIFDTARIHPRDTDPVSFVSFTPWQTIAAPILVPGHMHSFWTLIYSGMWFDTEPKYLYSIDRDPTWWTSYFKWLRGERPYPGGALPLSAATLLSARVLLAGGLVVLSLQLAGCWQLAKRIRAAARPLTERISLHLLPLLFVANAAGIVLLTLKAPVYSSMKSSYFLISLPAFAVVLALGLDCCRRFRWLQSGVTLVFCTLFFTSAWHILQIARSVAFSLGL